MMKDYISVKERMKGLEPKRSLKESIVNIFPLFLFLSLTII